MVEVDEVSNLVEEAIDESNGLTRKEQVREAVADFGGPRQVDAIAPTGQLPRSIGKQKQLEL